MPSSESSLASTASRTNVRDDRETPLQRGGTAGDIEVIWVRRQVKIRIFRIFLQIMAGHRTGKSAACLWMMPRGRPHIPPILQTIFHSSAVTGCTDSREYFTRAISASRLSALIAAIVTGVFNGLSALMSTQTNLPVLSLGSG